MTRRAEPLGPGRKRAAASKRDAANAAPRPERLAAFRLGLSAESRAAMFLIAKGYRILARRFRSPFGEIDIVARRRDRLVFVEVKARDTADAGFEAVSERNKRRIIAAAEAYLAKNPGLESMEIRFDVIAVTPGRLPSHIANAFDASAP